ncbi:MAG: glycerophosphoryl diester phosphodiesterase [Alphaproteobacteria bacterium]|nr:glycerophosphoryl diester phosphodiesterase [Alphaproteobacteria bacterium]
MRVPPVIGHRGASGHAPENTLVAIERAATLGARWVEVDAKLTADDVLILMHDDTLERTTNGRGAVAAIPYAEIIKLDAGSWFAPAFVGERIPTFAAFVATCQRLGLGANVEIKPCPGRSRATAVAVAEALRGLWSAGTGNVLVSSFDPEARSVFQVVAPEYPLGLLSSSPPTEAALDAAGRFASIHVDVKTLTKKEVKRLKSRGVPLLSYTVNEPKIARRLFGWGVDAVFSDVPDRILGALNA